jgi:hypothetical protein
MTIEYDDLVTSGTFPGWSNQPTANVTIGAATQMATGANQYVYAFNEASGTRPTTLMASTLELQGEGADIRINGVSLTDVLKNIEQRLNILRPNTELEYEWDQLRELGNRYRRLEAELKEKSRVWEKLKAMTKIDS